MWNWWITLWSSLWNTLGCIYRSFVYNKSSRPSTLQYWGCVPMEKIMKKTKDMKLRISQLDLAAKIVVLVTAIIGLILVIIKII